MATLLTVKPWVKSLKWWMSASMEDFISALLGGTHLASSVLTSPGTCRLSIVDTEQVLVGGVTCWHLVEALLYDPQTLPHLRHALQISVTRGYSV